ncbi:hypothetical protein BMT54_01695 [Pasteurellaceae bacterium 15-036681]|nr:hypothetical protein BMT54_01695 [Pasteurellaceae bacterium 15-036681]
MTSYTFRLDETLKQDAFSVFKSYGLNPAQAIKMFLQQVVATNSIPVQLDYQPNETTIRAMREIEEGKAIPLELKQGENLHDALMRIAMEPDDEDI